MIKKLCADGRIPGAYKTSSGWLIPKDAPYPERRLRQTKQTPQYNPPALLQRSTGGRFNVCECDAVKLRIAFNIEVYEFESLSAFNAAFNSYIQSLEDSLIETNNIEKSTVVTEAYEEAIEEPTTSEDIIAKGKGGEK